MKKLFILSFASILMLTGCGATETLSCSYKNTANNGETEIVYDIDHEDDEIKKVRITYDYKFNNNNNSGTNDNTRTTTNNNNNNNNDMNDDTFFDDNQSANLNSNDKTTNNDNNGTNNSTNGMVSDNNNGTNAANNDDDHIDGVGTGTDGTTSDTELDDDGIVDGIVGSAIDTIVGGVTDIILDSAGLRDRHQTVQNTYGNVNGFSVQNTTDVDDNYKVTYVIDFDTISDSDLSRLNLSRDLNRVRQNYVSQGFTCK